MGFFNSDELIINIHPHDRRVIGQLEEELGIVLPKISFWEVQDIHDVNGYALDRAGRVNTLGLKDVGLQSLASVATLLARLPLLENLNLYGNRITDLSPFYSLTQLTKLNLSDNKIVDLSSLANLTELTELELSGNRITDLPPLPLLTRLTELDLSSNKIADLSSLPPLVQLMKLNLSNNKIVDLSSLPNLTELTKLELSGNRITGLPPLAPLIRLTELDLSDNQIADLSPLEGLYKLERLDVRKNKIRRLPREMVDKTTMEIALENRSSDGINLYGNPLEEPPVEVVKQGREAVVNYFKQLPTEVRDHGDKTHGTFENMDPGQMIPCTCPGCTQSNKPHFYSYTKLINYKNKGRSHVTCDEHIVDVEVAPLLGNIQLRKEDEHPVPPEPTDPRKIKEEKKNERNKVFISYCRKDMKWLERVQVHLDGLHLEGLEIDLWHDNRIKPGEKWREEIDKALKATKVAILLVTPDFLASRFIKEKEIPHFLKAAEDDGATILPLVLKPCRFSKNPHLLQYQTVNDPKLPLSTLPEPEQDKLLVKLTDTIEDYLAPKP